MIILWQAQIYKTEKKSSVKEKKKWQKICLFQRASALRAAARTSGKAITYEFSVNDKNLGIIRSRTGEEFAKSERRKKKKSKEQKENIIYLHAIQPIVAPHFFFPFCTEIKYILARTTKQNKTKNRVSSPS